MKFYKSASSVTNIDYLDSLKLFFLDICSTCIGALSENEKLKKEAQLYALQSSRGLNTDLRYGIQIANRKLASKTKNYSDYEDRHKLQFFRESEVTLLLNKLGRGNATDATMKQIQVIFESLYIYEPRLKAVAVILNFYFRTSQVNKNLVQAEILRQYRKLHKKTDAMKFVLEEQGKRL